MNNLSMTSSIITSNTLDVGGTGGLNTSVRICETTVLAHLTLRGSKSRSHKIIIIISIFIPMALKIYIRVMEQFKSNLGWKQTAKI